MSNSKVEEHSEVSDHYNNRLGSSALEGALYEQYTSASPRPPAPDLTSDIEDGTPSDRRAYRGLHHLQSHLFPGARTPVQTICSTTWLCRAY